MNTQQDVSDRTLPFENAIRQLEHRIATAVVNRDIPFLEMLWDDRFVYTGVRGEVKTKADLIAEIGRGDLRFQTMEFHDLQIRVFGEMAIATGRALTVGTSNQGEIRGDFRYTRVYHYHANAWKLVAFQGTPLSLEFDK